MTPSGLDKHRIERHGGVRTLMDAAAVSTRWKVRSHCGSSAEARGMRAALSTAAFSLSSRPRWLDTYHQHQTHDVLLWGRL